jgi:hypothetical protein
MGYLTANISRGRPAVQKLGITCLWIDSLCIIQDSKDYWAGETAMIADVYEHCFLNISADTSANGSGGLFRNRDPKVDKSFIIPCPKSYIKKLGYCCYVDRWRNNVERIQLKKIKIFADYSGAISFSETSPFLYRSSTLGVYSVIDI